VAVASAGPYASVHLAPDRQPRQHPTTQFFLQAGCPSCRPTNSVKALKAQTSLFLLSNFSENFIIVDLNLFLQTSDFDTRELSMLAFKRHLHNMHVCVSGKWFDYRALWMREVAAVMCDWCGLLC